MRMIHLGDLHIGKNLGEYSLIDDQKYILDQILDIIRDREVQAVIIAGLQVDDPSEYTDLVCSLDRCL